MKINTKLLSSLPLIFFIFTLFFFLTNEPNHAQRTGKFIKNIVSSKCIDVSITSVKNKSPLLQLWDCKLNKPSNKTYQQWEITSDGFIINTLSGKCIDVNRDLQIDNGSRLQLSDCELNKPSDKTYQQWKITSNGFIQNKISNNSSDKCIDVSGAPGQDNGSPLQLWDCEKTGHNNENGSITDQIWLWCFGNRCELGTKVL